MNPFPVINSTLSAAHLGVFLQGRYDLSVGAVCSLLKTGINDTYLISNGTEKYVFRVYSLNWRTATEINEEIRLLNLLKENGVPVSYPIAGKEGVYIQHLAAPEGERLGVMFSFATGQKLLNFSEEIHYHIGEIMARMHLLTAGLKLQRVSYSSKMILEDSFEQLKRFLPAGNPEMDFMVSAQKYLLNEFDQLDLNDLRQGVVHLDIWFDNLAIDSQNRVTLFDFDFCGNGILCLDIAYYILQINSTEKDEEQCRLKMEAFLIGYESITRLTDEEKRIIPILGVSLYFFYLGIQCQRFDNWSNAFLNEGYLKRFINLLVKKYYDKNGLG